MNAHTTLMRLIDESLDIFEFERGLGGLTQEEATQIEGELLSWAGANLHEEVCSKVVWSLGKVHLHFPTLVTLGKWRGLLSEALEASEPWVVYQVLICVEDVFGIKVFEEGGFVLEYEKNLEKGRLTLSILETKFMNAEVS